MAIVLLVIPHPTRISMTLAYTLLGGAVYFTILLIIDKETIALIKAIFKEIMLRTKLKSNETKFNIFI